jgi:integrase
MPLTVIRVKSAKPKDKQYKLFDGGGMYLLVLPTGGRYWRLKYRIGGKEKVLALGVYPQVTLVEAREKRETAKKMLVDFKDPNTEKRLEKLNQGKEDNSFEYVAREWHRKQEKVLAESTAKDTLSKLANHVFPYVGTRVISEITSPELLAVLRRLESAGKISATHRTKQIVGRVFRYAVATGRATHDPAADLKGALTPESTIHHASITDPMKIGELLRVIDTYTGTFPVKCALQLAPLLFVRPGELRRAEWDEINFLEKQWVIPSYKAKMKRDHIVPLSTHVIAIIKELQLLTGRGRYLFSTTKKPMSENTINKALKNLGYTSKVIVGHGFRSMASTILHEQGWNSDVIERQLAHVESNEVKRTYNKAKHLGERVRIMQEWSDYLFELKADGSDKVVHFRQNNS